MEIMREMGKMEMVRWLHNEGKTHWDDYVEVVVLVVVVLEMLLQSIAV